MAKRKQWSKTIEEQGIRVRLYRRKRGGPIYREVRIDGRKDRQSLGHSDAALAEDQARAFARELASAQLSGRPLGSLTLGQLFQVYFHHKGRTLSSDWQKASQTRGTLFERAWGLDLAVGDLSQTHVDGYAAARRSGKLTPLGKGSGQGDRSPVKVRDGTIDADFRWLSSVFNWARKHKVNGRRLLLENPLHDVSWPREKNARRPVASHRRYLASLEYVDDVDPEGRLRAILALARWTGRRESAICNLMASDVLLTSDRTRAALAEAGMDERLADHMPHGAIRWDASTDKMGLLHISPISSSAREEVDLYLQRAPRIGDAPLFPAPSNTGAPIRRDTAATWLLRAEQAAKLPKLVGGTFHPYRRLWASERKSLPDVDVAAAGGWKDTRALKISYQHADPETVLKVVENG